MTTIAERVARSRREIMEDVKRGIVPRTVTSFSDLHDYVDANEYGGLCEDDAMEGDVEDFIALGNAVQDEVDRWIKTGALKRVKRVSVNRDGQPVGYVVRVNRDPERWTAFVFCVEAPFDEPVLGFDNSTDAVEYVLMYGETPEHLRVRA